LVITNSIDFLPGVEPYEADITIDFFVSDANVRMVVTLDPLHSEEFSRMQLEGFTSQLRKLERRFAAS
ncbi:MAG: SRPBCC domain-containing protein, partial [Polyangiales bacterium]